MGVMLKMGVQQARHEDEHAMDATMKMGAQWARQ
jgi:hypothetical protein